MTSTGPVGDALRPGSVEHARAKWEARRQAKMAVRRSAYGPVQLAEYLGAPVYPRRPGAPLGA